MNPFLKKLVEISQKDERKIIGLMSGTSLDGLDIAICNIRESGRKTAVELERFTTIQYPPHVLERLREVVSRPSVDLKYLTVLNAWLGTLHAEMILQALSKWAIPVENIDLIASHGQTAFHAPISFHQIKGFPNATLQIGDGDHIAVGTGIITISDFRQKNIAAGGEGAPLAAYGDFFLFKNPGENRILLNIGGIANFTWLPASTEDTLVVSDTGPGNALIDAAVRKNFQGKRFDLDGEIAASGRIDERLLMILKSDTFFSSKFPKSSGLELFNIAWLENKIKEAGIKEISSADLVATLTRLSAETIADCIKENIENWEDANVYVSGGGSHNPVLTAHIKELMNPCSIKTNDTLGIPSDAKEAVLFAVLANETVSGNNTFFENLPSVSMGKISFPG